MSPLSNTPLGCSIILILCFPFVNIVFFITLYFIQKKSLENNFQTLYDTYKNGFAITFIKTHITTPTKVGNKKDTVVHFTLFVSFAIVQSVVAQGK